MREELEQYLTELRSRRNAIAPTSLRTGSTAYYVLDEICTKIGTILAKDAEKPSEGQETQKNGISGLVRDHKIRMAGFTEGYAQGLEAAANFVDDKMEAHTSTASQLRDEAERVRTEVAK